LLVGCQWATFYRDGFKITVMAQGSGDVTDTNYFSVWWSFPWRRILKHTLTAHQITYYLRVVFAVVRMNAWLHKFTCLRINCTGVLISPQPDQEGNNLQRQKILSFIYPTYKHNWKNIRTIDIYKD